MLKLIIIMILLNIMFLISQHPLMLALILMLVTLVNSLMTGMFNLNYWFSFMLFMIMIGGMLVLIIYMTTIASNEMMEKSLKYLPIIGIMTMVFILMPDTLSINTLIKSTESCMMEDIKFNAFLSKFIMTNHLPLIILTINYLFITLIAIVKITCMKYGSLRQKF